MIKDNDKVWKSKKVECSNCHKEHNPNGLGIFHGCPHCYVASNYRKYRVK